MRATYRCSRNGSAKHNDRTFNLDKAEHIDQELTAHNWNWHCFAKVLPEASFAEVEELFYEKRYSASLEAINSRYRAQYHPERCKTIKDLLEGPKTCPSETLLQAGSKDDHPDYHILAQSMKEFMDYLASWNRENGNHLHILNFALHVDESTPHIHMRTCWDYTDKDGNPRLGQEKGLELSGIDLPKPEKSVGRYNNRKMTFDEMVRTKWQDILKSHGLEIETKPLPRRKHKGTEEYIDEQIAKKQSELQRLDSQVEWTRDLRDKQQERWK